MEETNTDFRFNPAVSNLQKELGGFLTIYQPTHPWVVIRVTVTASSSGHSTTQAAVKDVSV